MRVVRKYANGQQTPEARRVLILPGHLAEAIAIAAMQMHSQRKALPRGKKTRLNVIPYDSVQRADENDLQLECDTRTYLSQGAPVLRLSYNGNGDIGAYQTYADQLSARIRGLKESTSTRLEALITYSQQTLADEWTTDSK